MPMTLHDRYCAGLKAMGMVEQPKKNRYTVYKRNDKDRYYFVGSSGALRVNSRPNAATSIPCNDTFKQKVLDAPLAELGL